jgi:hypothetical protein
MRYLIYRQVAGLLGDLRKQADVKRLIPMPTGPEAETAPDAATSADPMPPADAVPDDGAAVAPASAAVAAAPQKPAGKQPEVLKTDPLPPGHHFFAPPKLKKK